MKPLEDSKLFELAARHAPADVLVTSAADAEIEATPERVLVDVQRMSPVEVLDRWRERQKAYRTTPVDPDGEKLRLLPGGVTVWSGYPGAGKTTVLRQMACQLAAEGEKVFFASLEEDPEDLMIRLCQVAYGLGIQEPTDIQFATFLNWSRGRLFVWGRVGIASHREILAAVRSLARRGLTHAIIDSLMCLDVANDDFELQRKFANLLAATARSTRVHVHLVAHPRKVLSVNQEPDLNDVAGARELGGIADNVVFIRRVKEETISLAKGIIATVCKNRHGGTLGDIHATFRMDYRQIHDHGDRFQPFVFVQEPA